ncbi:MAG: hypothetical protein CFE44_21235 [Burkholderiales bacterium PBB4]|nr:MAG: hypothetical protein CFE44_21235 [Burkholderiales bacterium PBB4]
MIGEFELKEYLEAHTHVDILLDTFPYPGGTTTAFALWMGVPTVTLAGDTMLSRQGVAMLRCVGLENWIAKSVSEYIEIACRFANLPELLLQIRSSLRDITLKSPLFDCQQFAAQFQDALLKMHDRKTDSN